MIRILVSLALLFCLSNFVDAKCGGSAAGRSSRRSARMERRQPKAMMSMSYSSSYMMRGPVIQTVPMQVVPMQVVPLQRMPTKKAGKCDNCVGP